MTGCLVTGSPSSLPSATYMWVQDESTRKEARENDTVSTHEFSSVFSSSKCHICSRRISQSIILKTVSQSVSLMTLDALSCWGTTSFLHCVLPPLHQTGFLGDPRGQGTCGNPQGWCSALKLSFCANVLEVTGPKSDLAYDGPLVTLHWFLCPLPLGAASIRLFNVK